MNHSVAQILVRYLTGAGVLDSPNNPPAVNATPWPGYVAYLPADGPGTSVVAVDTTPAEIANLLNGPKLQWWGVQFMVRGGPRDYPTAWAKACGIKAFWEAVAEFSVEFDDNSYAVHQVYMDSGPLYLGPEEQTQRHLFSINYLVHLTEQ